MAITLIRVDDRVIHGQIVMRWSKVCKCDEIIIVENTIANDRVLSTIYKNAAPSGVKVNIYTTEESIPAILNAQKDKKGYFLVVKTITTLQKIFEKIDIRKEVIFGPASAKPGARVIGRNQSLTEDEIEACEFLHQKGVDIVFRLMPDQKGFRWSDKRKEIIK